jgi:hypothetical protein
LRAHPVVFGLADLGRAGLAEVAEMERGKFPALQVAIEAMIVTPKANAPIVMGTFDEPGGATAAKTAGKSAVSIVPMFWAVAMPETRARLEKSSG